MNDWEFVKHRTAEDGAVWRSTDGRFYKRTGDVLAEARFQQQLTDLGYPVPKVVETGETDGVAFFIEASAGTASLHDRALAEADPAGHVGDELLAVAEAVSADLMRAQAANPLPTAAEPRDWFDGAAFAADVTAENPDLDTPRVRDLVTAALERLAGLPMCHSHLDYGLPNAFPGAVIDWQHHGPAPLGYDVYPMLDIAAFKGGNRGYQFTPVQRARYRTALDQAATTLTGQSLSAYMGEFLLVKCFFFLALMRPGPHSRPGKRLKWAYRRTLFAMGVDQYESSGTIDTGAFPTLATFTQARPDVSGA